MMPEESGRHAFLVFVQRQLKVGVGLNESRKQANFSFLHGVRETAKRGGQLPRVSGLRVNGAGICSPEMNMLREQPVMGNGQGDMEKGKFISGMKLLLVLFFLECACMNRVLAQQVGGNALGVLAPKVTFLSHAPQIDGILDAELKTLPVRRFNFIEKSNSENPVIAADFRLAYGTGFLYVYIEADADSFICRDRGYQNGDGFILVLAIPRPGSRRTNEFHVMGFSAQQGRGEDNFKKIRWYYNVDLSFRRLGKDTRFEHAAENGKIGFELLLPWKEVYPYHPWISDAIGFNLAFVKAIGKAEKNWYLVVLDEKIASEQNGRLYTELRFQEPDLGSGIQTYMLIDRNCNKGDNVRAKVATLSAESSRERIQFSIYSGEGEWLNSGMFGYECRKGLTVTGKELKTSHLIPGGYKVKWKSLSGGMTAETGLTVFPDVDICSLNQRIEKLKGRISAGSLATYQFRLEQVERGKKQLKPYEICSTLRMELTELMELVRKAEEGKDVLAARTGILRRAYRSKVDNTLQPYTVRIPEDFDENRRYPLLVYLHGSGEDDRGQLNDRRAPEGFIELAPFGRGTSNCYSADHAQIDIQEAIEDVIRHYPVDTDHIVLAGFSMGGYGVYRTFYETPERFKAVAVFSGHPDLANKWLPGGGYPNFLDENYLKSFRKIPVFIYHGKKDRNIPFQLAAQVVEKLRSAGAEVEFCVDEESGHNISARIQNEYFEWLKMIVGKL